jgi:UDP-2,3-diacylglucosamine hydrolase
MRSLGLMCGAGPLPARMAAEARRQGWHIVAFTFPGAGEADGWADVVIPSRLEAMNPVLEGLAREKIAGMLFSGKFWMGDLLGSAPPDAAHATMAARAGTLLDDNITRVIVETLTAFGVELLDQRPFFGDWLEPAGCVSQRTPTDAEWVDVRRGLAVTRLMSGAQIGQVVVVRRGVVSAVEAIEGTTETIRRGTSLSGPGAVVVKGVAATHDFRFDTPGIGPDTLAAAAAGGASVVAIEAGRVAIIDRATVVAHADAAGIALVSVDAAE